MKKETKYFSFPPVLSKARTGDSRYRMVENRNSPSDRPERSEHIVRSIARWWSAAVDEQALVYSLLFCILSLGFFLRIYYFEGIDFDGTMLTLQAKNIQEGIYDPRTLSELPYGQGIRLAAILPITLSFILFGISEWSAILPIFLSSMLGIVVIYYFGKLLFTQRIGLLAAFLLAIFPLDVNNASILELDIMLGLFTTVVVLLYYKAVENKKSYYFLVAGILLGITIFVKIIGILIIPFFLLYELIFIKDFKASLRHLTLLFIGCLLGALPFLLYFFFATGNPFYFYVIENNANDILLSTNIFDLSYYPKNMLLLKTYNEPPLLSISFILCFFSVWHYLRKRTKETTMLIVWLLSLFLLLEFIPTIPKTQRYLLLLETPLLLLIAKGIYDFAITDLNKKIKGVILFCLLLLTLFVSFQQYGQYYLFGNEEYYYEGKKVNHEEEAIYLALQELPERDIYITSYDMIPLLSFYFQYTKNSSVLYGYKGPTNTSIYDLHYVTTINEIEDSYVILDHRVIDNDNEGDPFHYYNKTEGNIQWFSGNMTIPPNWYGYVLFPMGSGDTKKIVALFYVK